MDVGAPLFGATSWPHRGYNVSVANLHERAIARDADGYYVTTNGDRLRLFHFHAFDPHTPDQLTTRSDLQTAHLRAESEALEELCVEYADQVIRHEKDLPTPPSYVYATDTRGRKISRHLRRAYRVESAASSQPLPTAFVAADADAYEAWRRRARKTVARELLNDTVKSARLVFPEEYGQLKARFPSVTEKLRGRFHRATGIWR